jgi:hypothetical protein
MRRRIPTAIGTASLLLLLVAQPVLAVEPCWGGVNVGAARSNQSSVNTWDGVRTHQDFVSATVPNNITIVHPMQLAMINGDFIGWGTVRGEGTAQAPVENCDDDYSAGWHLYVDGKSFGQYFCRNNFSPTVSDTAVDKTFTMSYGDCLGLNRFRVYYEGTRKDCRHLNGTKGLLVGAGSELVGSQSPGYDVTIHYFIARKRAAADLTWYAWTVAAQFECENTGYQVRHISADNFWTEEIP